MRARIAIWSILLGMLSASSSLMAQDDVLHRDSFEARYAVSGAVSGLVQTGLELSVNAEGLIQKLQLNTNGNFIFPVSIEDGVAYKVTVSVQPSDRNCGVAQGQGVASSEISNIRVDCVAPGQLTWDTGVWGNNWN